MSAHAFKAASAGTAPGPKAAVSRSNKHKSGTARSGSCDLADHSSLVPVKSGAPSKPPKALPLARSHSKKLAYGPDNGRPVSRLELLLAPKDPKPVYQPPEETPATAGINKAIKLAAQWTDVEKAVVSADFLSASNVAYAIYRLGCLFTFTSSYRQQEILNSGLTALLMTKAQQKLHHMDAGSVTLLLDGCARLKYRPPERLLTGLANLVHSFALTFEASQLPLVLWAFDRLKYTPRMSVLSALDSAADKLVPVMLPQGLALVLRGFQATSYKPTSRTLARAAEAMQRQLAQYKPSEIATCMDAFAAFGYKPPGQLLAAVAQQGGRSVNSNIVTGKPPLSQKEAGKGTNGEHLSGIAEESGRPSARPLAAASRMLRQVSDRVVGLDSALGGVSSTPSHPFPNT